jgi:hypothetical protein
MKLTLVILFVTIAIAGISTVHATPYGMGRRGGNWNQWKSMNPEQRQAMKEMMEKKTKEYGPKCWDGENLEEFKKKLDSKLNGDYEEKKKKWEEKKKLTPEERKSKKEAKKEKWSKLSESDRNSIIDASKAWKKNKMQKKMDDLKVYGPKFWDGENVDEFTNKLDSMMVDPVKKKEALMKYKSMSKEERETAKEAKKEKWNKLSELERTEILQSMKSFKKSMKGEYNNNVSVPYTTTLPDSQVVGVANPI